MIIDGTTKEGRNYPIRPKHINTKRHFFSAFGRAEPESSAALIVRLCQTRGGWLPFTQEEIDGFIGKDFYFHDLCGFDHRNPGNMVILGDDDKYRVTHEFIVRCFQSSPAF
ncbi:MAG TPA: hypothetical protein P5056_02000 [Candidatus Paceibacterota bacterium]|nr:hypothetical protein [Candidatus Paceibacterota bacterium]